MRSKELGRNTLAGYRLAAQFGNSASCAQWRCYGRTDSPHWSTKCLCTDALDAGWRTLTTTPGVPVVCGSLRTANVTPARCDA